MNGCDTSTLSIYWAIVHDVFDNLHHITATVQQFPHFPSMEYICESSMLGVDMVRAVHMHHGDEKPNTCIAGLSIRFFFGSLAVSQASNPLL